MVYSGRPSTLQRETRLLRVAPLMAREALAHSTSVRLLQLRISRPFKETRPRSSTMLKATSLLSPSVQGPLTRGTAGMVLDAW